MVVEIAKSKGLKLDLYGRGWQDNEEFAPYAAGSSSRALIWKTWCDRAK